MQGGLLLVLLSVVCVASGNDSGGADLLRRSEFALNVTSYLSLLCVRIMGKAGSILSADAAHQRDELPNIGIAVHSLKEASSTL